MIQLVILNNQIFGRPLTSFPASLFDWTASTAVTGGGTVSSLDYVHGETNPESFEELSAGHLDKKNTDLFLQCVVFGDVIYE